jgi:hypothetical protein
MSDWVGNLDTVEAYDGCFADGKVWFPHLEYNALYSLDIMTGLLCFEDYIPDERIDKIYLYTKMHRIGSKLVFVPCSADSIAVYDIQQKQFTKYPLSLDKVPSCCLQREYNKFLGAIEKDGYIYLIGGSWPVIIRLNPVNGDQVYLLNWYLENMNLFDTDMISFGNAELVGDDLYIPLHHVPMVLKIHLPDGSYSMINFDSRYSGFSGIKLFKNDFWLIPKEQTPILCWNEKENRIREENIDYDRFDQVKRTFRKAFVIGDYLWIIPDQINCVVRIDNNAEIKIYELGNESKRNNVKSDALFTMAINADHNILCLDECRGKVIWLLDDNEVKINNFNYKVKNPFGSYEKYYENAWQSYFVVNESEIASLDQWLSYLVSHHITIEEDNQSGVGKKIHEVIKHL